MMTILTSSYMDAGSAGCFVYSKPLLVHSELLEKEVRAAQVEDCRKCNSSQQTTAALMVSPVVYI